MGARAGQLGFTLIEVLVVMLLIAALAAIAVPAFFSQREKAFDADAKADLASAQLAIETYAADSGGSYAGADVDDLADVESSLTDADLAVISSSDGTYHLRVVSEGGHWFELERAAGGSLDRTCGPSGAGGCTPPGTW